MAKSITVEVEVSPENRDIVLMLAEGLTVEEIATKRNVHKRQLDAQLYRLKIKHGCINITNLVATFLREGIIK